MLLLLAHGPHVRKYETRMKEFVGLLVEEVGRYITRSTILH